MNRVEASRTSVVTKTNVEKMLESRNLRYKERVRERELQSPLASIPTVVNRLWNMLDTTGSLGNLSRSQITSRIEFDALKALHTDNTNRDDFLPDQPRKLEELPDGWSGLVYSCEDHHDVVSTSIVMTKIESGIKRVVDIDYEKDSDGVEEVRIELVDHSGTGLEKDRITKELTFRFSPTDTSYEVHGRNEGYKTPTARGYDEVHGRVTQSQDGVVTEDLEIY
jgi:hypothetical protein